MFLYWILLFLVPGFVPGICKPSSTHLAKKKDIPRGFFSKEVTPKKEKGHFAFLKRNKVSMSDRLADEQLKHGSFKIDDGKVIGGGIYEINKDGVSIDLKIKIEPDFPEAKPSSPNAQPTTSATGPSATGPSATGPTAEPTTASASTGSAIEQEALELHNKFRAVHDAPAMKLNAEMSQSAAKYAQTIANLGSLQHSSKEERDSTGENLSYGCSSSTGQTTAEAVTNWYNEVCDPGYSFGSESMGGAGHFTQMVWKESVELGFGKADSDKNGMKCTYYVARYKKAGNMQGDFAENVVKGSFDESYCSTIKKSNLKRLKY